MSTVTIQVGEESVELDVEVMVGYRDEAFEILKKEAEAKKDFKSAMELQAEGLGIEKAIWQKYVKAAFKAKTKEQSKLGEAFAAMDKAAEDSGNQSQD